MSRLEDDHDALIRLLGGYEEFRVNHDAVHQAEKEDRASALAELQRRLDVLNHAHEEAVRVQNTYLRQDTFDAELARLRDDIRRVADSLSDQMPRSEIRLAIEAISGRVDSVVNAVAQMNSLLAQLRGSLAGQSEGGEEAQRGQDRSRALIAACFTIGLGIIGLVITLLAFKR